MIVICGIVVWLGGMGGLEIGSLVMTIDIFEFLAQVDKDCHFFVPSSRVGCRD